MGKKRIFDISWGCQEVIECRDIDFWKAWARPGRTLIECADMGSDIYFESGLEFGFLGLFLDSEFDLLTWARSRACSPRKTRANEKPRKVRKCLGLDFV